MLLFDIVVVLRCFDVSELDIGEFSDPEMGSGVKLTSATLHRAMLTLRGFAWGPTPRSLAFSLHSLDRPH